MLAADKRARAARFAPAEVRGRVFNPMVRPRWIDGTDWFWYPHESAEGVTCVAVDAATGGRAPFTPEPSPARDERPGDNVSPNGRWAAFRRGDDLWARDIATGEERALTNDGAPHYAPDWAMEDRRPATPVK